MVTERTITALYYELYYKMTKNRLFLQRSSDQCCERHSQAASTLKWESMSYESFKPRLDICEDTQALEKRRATDFCMKNVKTNKKKTVNWPNKVSNEDFHSVPVHCGIGRPSTSALIRMARKRE